MSRPPHSLWRHLDLPFGFPILGSPAVKNNQHRSPGSRGQHGGRLNTDSSRYTWFIIIASNPVQTADTVQTTQGYKGYVYNPNAFVSAVLGIGSA